MSQKNDIFRVVEILEKGPRHVRQLASDLGSNPTTAMRLLRQLEGANVVDFETQGRNKTYSLKDTPEAHTHLLLAEHLKLLRLLKDPTMRKMWKRLKDATEGELIILYGSHAKGEATKRSDIDLYIETDNRALKKEVEDISEKLEVKAGKLDKNSLLSKEIVKDHVVLQNAERFYDLTRWHPDRPSRPSPEKASSASSSPARSSGKPTAGSRRAP
ncbi:MAG: nucleotidyltransferase domain-containing protein [Candidatus Woesearchaeota archaeon]